MMLVGITGTIASGKSVVARILELLGYNVFYADNEAKKLYSLPDVASEINAAAGFSLVNASNPDFNAIANFAFEYSQHNDMITSVLYPKLLDVVMSWKKKFPDNGLLFVEAALIFESGWYKYLDKTICVHANQEVRYQRLKLRNPHNYESCIQRAKLQFNDEEKMRLADFLICNNDDVALMPQIMNIISRLK